MKEASSTQLDLAAFCQEGKLSCAFHHAKCGCTTPLVGALLQLCSDSALILLHSAVMLELAYYAKNSASIIRICLVCMYYSCHQLVFHLISSFVCFAPYSGAKYYLPRKFSYRRKPNFYQYNRNIQISPCACYGLTPYRQHH